MAAFLHLPAQRNPPEQMKHTEAGKAFSCRKQRNLDIQYES